MHFDKGLVTMPKGHLWKPPFLFDATYRKPRKEKKSTNGSKTEENIQIFVNKIE